MSSSRLLRNAASYVIETPFELLADHSEADYKDAVADINSDLNFDGTVRTVGHIFTDNQPTDWATEALSRERLDFTDLEDREAIGMAKVYSEHGKSEEEFRAYWQQHQRSRQKEP